MNRKYLPTRPSKLICFILVGAVIIQYLFSAFIYNQFYKPAAWLGLAYFTWLVPKPRIKGKLRLQENVTWWAFIFAFIFIIVSILAGLIDGFGRSPYDLSLKGMLFNILIVGATLVGSELVRSYLVNTLTKKENYLVFIIIALFLTFVGFSLHSLMNLKGYENIVKFLAQYFAPEFCKNLLATYLAYLGGPLPAITYMGVILAFHWLSPILPDLQWITAALVGVFSPVFSMMAIQNLYSYDARDKKNMDSESTAGWLVTSLVSVGIIWFAVGVFPVYPSVIATGSMKPLIKPGDVILVQRISEKDDLKIGDIIQFKRDNVLISHRIIEIIEEKNIKNYRTKGDNNSVTDFDLVKPQDIRGRITQVIPKVGWPTLLLKSKDAINLIRYEF